MIFLKVMGETAKQLSLQLFKIYLPKLKLPNIKDPLW